MLSGKEGKGPTTEKRKEEVEGKSAEKTKGAREKTGGR